MSMDSFRRPLLVPVVVLALLPALLIALPALADNGEADPSAAEQVHDHLEHAIDFTVVKDWTLHDALEYLSDHYHLTFDVDQRAFDCAKVKPLKGKLCPFTKTDALLKDVLFKLLRESESSATYVIIGGRIVITTDEGAVGQWMRQSVTVRCENAELAAVLKKLARETCTNLAIDSKVEKIGQTPVTVQVQDVPLETAIVLLAEMVDLKPIRVGNKLLLTTPARAKELRADPEQACQIGPCPLPPRSR